MPAPAPGAAMARTFASYRDAIEQSRDPAETSRTRERAWSRAANHRARLERMFVSFGAPA